MSTFDFSPVISRSKEIIEYLIEYRTSFNAEAIIWIEQLLEGILSIQKTAEKFQQQLLSLLQEPTAPEENATLQERVKVAATYFSKQLELILQTIQRSSVTTDSRLHAKEFNESLKDIFSQLSLKKHLLDGYEGRFNMEGYHRRKKNFVLPPFRVNAYGGCWK